MNPLPRKHFEGRIAEVDLRPTRAGVEVDLVLDASSGESMTVRMPAGILRDLLTRELVGRQIWGEAVIIDMPFDPRTRASRPTEVTIDFSLTD